MQKFVHTYDQIISLENLLGAWREFAAGKRGRPDVQKFSFQLMANIIALHLDLTHHSYRHGPYHQFKISDPKPRIIHKALVRDRVVHRALYRSLYWYFHQRFICDSFSCQLGKGTHRALNRFRALAYQASANHTQTLWLLKADIKKFFASINQNILLNLLANHIIDDQIMNLIRQIVSSFHSTLPGIGLPLGNLTSQLFANVYLNDFDQFLKHELKVKHYLRYADDFVIMHEDRNYLHSLLPQLQEFLATKLKLSFHPDKVFLKTFASGVDFLGWTHFPNHRVLRTVTKRRMFKRLAENPQPATVNSYLGLLGWGRAYGLKQKLIGELLLALGAKVGAPAGEFIFADRPPAAAARRAGAAVHLEISEEVAFRPVAAAVIARGGAALSEREFEQADNLPAQFFNLGGGERAGAAGGQNAGGEAALVRVNIAQASN